MANPYTPRHITDANIIAGTSAQPHIEKMVKQIRLLSKVVIKLRRQLTVHPQPAQDVPTHILPPQPQKTPITRKRLSYVEGYRQNEEEPPRNCSRSPTRERSHRPKVLVRSEHSHIVQTSHHGKERVHHFHRSMLDSFSSSGSHRERPRKKAKKNSRHHQPTHQYQMEGSTLSKRVLEVKVPKEYLSAKMNLDKYDGLTNPREYIQNVRGALS